MLGAEVGEQRPLGYTGLAMYERKRPSEGDILGSAYGDLSGEFPDWDNPEDELDEREEGADGDAGEPEISPDDPDYDLSEDTGYAGWEAPRHGGAVPQGLIVA